MLQSTSNKCTEGCECDSGFLFNGQTCVSETECGCYENGKTYKVKFSSFFYVHSVSCTKDGSVPADNTLDKNSFLTSLKSVGFLISRGFIDRLY